MGEVRTTTSAPSSTSERRRSGSTAATSKRHRSARACKCSQRVHSGQCHLSASAGRLCRTLFERQRRKRARAATRASPGANQKCFTRAARELNVLCVSCPRRGRAQLPVQRQERQQLQQPPSPLTCCDTPSVARAAPEARGNGAHHRVQLEPAEARARRGRFSLVLERWRARQQSVLACATRRRHVSKQLHVAARAQSARCGMARVGTVWRWPAASGGVRSQVRMSWPLARRSRAVRAAAPHSVSSAKALGTWRARD